MILWNTCGAFMYKEVLSWWQYCAEDIGVFKQAAVSFGKVGWFHIWLNCSYLEDMLTEAPLSMKTQDDRKWGVT